MQTELSEVKLKLTVSSHDIDVNASRQEGKRIRDCRQFQVTIKKLENIVDEKSGTVGLNERGEVR